MSGSLKLWYFSGTGRRNEDMHISSYVGQSGINAGFQSNRLHDLIQNLLDLGSDAAMP
jgi:hypothetical protein